MKGHLWLLCSFTAACSAAQNQRPAPGEFAGPSAALAAPSADAVATPEAQPTRARASSEPRTPTPAPNTSIEPAESQAVCDAAIAVHNATASQATTTSRSTPVVQPGATVTGLLSPEQIRRTTLQNIGQLGSCLEQWQAYDPSFDGRVVARFVIGADGAVIVATVAETSTTSTFLRQCIVNAIRTWRFDAPQGGGVVTVNYPFNLRRPEE
jgi:TonB family protein